MNMLESIKKEAEKGERTINQSTTPQSCTKWGQLKQVKEHLL